MLALEGSSIGHNVARRGLVGELHAPHLLDACHKLTCTESPRFGMQPDTKICDMHESTSLLAKENGWRLYGSI